MRMETHAVNGTKIAVITSEGILLSDAQQAVELIAGCSYMGGSNNIVIEAGNITPAFFDLKSGIAGEILQKFSNYHARLAIVGDFSVYSGRSLSDFIRESNATGRILFVSSLDDALEKLSV